MPGMLGEFIVIAALAIVTALAARSVWKSHKSGGHCNGDCGGCGGCRGGCHSK